MFCGRAIVSTSTQDQWAQWLLERRHGGDLERHDSVIDALIPVRDQVLDKANPAQGEVLLDVGTGDGLIAFGALPRLESLVGLFLVMSLKIYWGSADP